MKNIKKTWIYLGIWRHKYMQHGTRFGTSNKMENGGDTTITIPGASLSVISSDVVWQILDSRLFRKAFKITIKYTEIIELPLILSNNIHIKTASLFSMWYIKNIQNWKDTLMESDNTQLSKSSYTDLPFIQILSESFRFYLNHSDFFPEI